MNTVPKEHMGVISGFIDMAGQIAAFVAPLSVGYPVGAAQGNFGVTFGFFVTSLLESCAIVFTLPASYAAPRIIGSKDHSKPWNSRSTSRRR
jgi:nitrate/nitrite transporter NarK